MATTTSTTTTRTTTTAPAKTTTPTTVKAPTVTTTPTTTKTAVSAPVSKPMYFSEATKSWTYGTAPVVPAPAKVATTPIQNIVKVVSSGVGGGVSAVTSGISKIADVIKSDVSQAVKAVSTSPAAQVIKSDVSQGVKSIAASPLGKTVSAAPGFVSDVVTGAKITASGTPPMYFDTATSSWKYGTAPAVTTPTPPKITVTGGGGAVSGPPVTPVSLVSGLPKTTEGTSVVTPPKVEIKRDLVGKSVTTVTAEKMVETSPFGTKVTTPTRPMFFDPYEQRWRYGTIEKTDEVITKISKDSLSTTSAAGTETKGPGEGKIYDVDANFKELSSSPDVSKGLMTVTREGDTIIVKQPTYKMMVNEGYDIKSMEKAYSDAPEVGLGLLKVSRSGDTLTIERPIYATTVQPYGTEAQKQLESKMETIWKQATPLEKIGLGAQFIMTHGVSGKGAEFILSPESRTGYIATQLTGAATDKWWAGKEMFSAATEGIPSVPISAALGYGAMSVLKVPAIAGALGGVSEAGAGLVSKIPYAGTTIGSVLEFTAAHPRAVGSALVLGFEGLKATEMATGKYLTLGGIVPGEVKSPAFIFGSVGGDIARIAAFGAGMKWRMAEDLPKVDVKYAKINVHEDMKTGELGDATVKSNLIDPKTGKVAGTASFDGQVQKLPDDPSHPDENFYRIDGDVSYKVKGGAAGTKEVTGPGMVKKLYPPGEAPPEAGAAGEITEHVDTTFHISKVKLYDATNKFKIDFINNIMNPDNTQVVIETSRSLGKATEAEAVSKKVMTITSEKPFKAEFRPGEEIDVTKITGYTEVGGERLVGGKEITPALGKTLVYESPRTTGDSLSKLMQGLEPPKETEAEALKRIKSSLDIKPPFKPFDFTETPTGTPSGAGVGTGAAGGVTKAAAGGITGPSPLSKDLVNLADAFKGAFSEKVSQELMRTITTPIMPIVSAAAYTGAQLQTTTKYTPTTLIGQLTTTEEGYRPVSITGVITEKPEPIKPVPMPSGTVQATQQEVTTITTPILEPPTTVQQEIQKIETGVFTTTFTAPIVPTPPPFFPFITGFGGGGGGGGGEEREKERKEYPAYERRTGWSLLSPDLFSKAVSQAAFGKATTPKFTKKQVKSLQAQSLIRVPTAEFMEHPEEFSASTVLKKLIG